MPKWFVRSATVLQYIRGCHGQVSIICKMAPVMLHRTYQQRKHRLPCNSVPLTNSCFDVTVTI